MPPRIQRHALVRVPHEPTEVEDCDQNTPRDAIKTLLAVIQDRQYFRVMISPVMRLKSNRRNQCMTGLQTRDDSPGPWTQMNRTTPRPLRTTSKRHATRKTNASLRLTHHIEVDEFRALEVSHGKPAVQGIQPTRNIASFVVCKLDITPAAKGAAHDTVNSTGHL